MINNYYYNLFNKEQQKAYHAMYQGLSQLESSFYVPRLSGSELSDIYFALRMDHPEIFYTVNFSYRYYENSENVELIPDYIFEKKKIKEHIAALESRVNKLVRACDKKTDLEKELYIHDFICQNIKYDKLKKPYSHEIIGALGQGVAVCEGIAKAVKILCDKLGIWCIVALSHSNPDKNIKYRHAWNVVKINGKFYHLDATFDNSLGDGSLIRYDYFNLSDKQLFRDHQELVWKVPPCEDGSKSYYQEKKVSFTKLEDIRKRGAQAVKKGRTFVFHYRGGYLTREVFKKILEILKEEAEVKGKYPVISLNWPQAVFVVNFKEIEADDKEDHTEVNLQEANEGEIEVGA